MNNNFVKFAIVGIACAAFCTTTIAAPKGGHHGGNGRPASATQQTRTPQVARPAAKPSTAKPSAAKPSAAKHAAPACHPNPPAVARHGNARPEPRHHAPPPRIAHHHAPPPRVAHHHAPPPHAFRHHIPSHARYWARPAVPLWHVGALRAWEWITQEWMIVVDGVYYYGDGYYYDGYNYYYNGEYHAIPPPPIIV